MINDCYLFAFHAEESEFTNRRCCCKVVQKCDLLSDDFVYLVIVDELGRGSSSREGAAIASSVFSYLAERFHVVDDDDDDDDSGDAAVATTAMNNNNNNNNNFLM